MAVSARHMLTPTTPAAPTSTATGLTTQPASSPVTASSDWFSQNMPPASTSAPDPMQGALTQSFGGGSAPTGGYGGQFVAPTGVTFMNDPGYQFRIDQGNRAVQNSAFAKGTGLTGGAIKDLLNYGQGAASAEFQNVFNRDLAGQTFNRDTAFGNQDRALNSYLASRDTFWGDTDRLFGRNFSLAQLGENAAAGYGNNLGQYGAGGSDTLTGIGNSGAAGTIGTGNAIAGGIGKGASMAALLAQQARNRRTAPTLDPNLLTGGFGV